MSSRWLALVIFVVLLAIISLRDKESWKYKISHYGMFFLEGMVGGLIIDSIGVNAGYYYFPRQPLYSIEYWAIVIPAWGVFGLALNYLWRVVGKDKFIRGTMITLPILFAWYEGTNLLTHSWVYTVPFHVVVLGWIPLIYVFSGCDHRREVVFKIDSWIRQCENEYYRFGLQSLRVLLVVVMFPLLFVSIGKVIRDLFIIKRANISVKEYALAYLMIK